MKSAVQVDRREQVVIKRVARDSLLREVRTTEHAYKLAESSRLFRVPQIRDYDLSQGWIKLEYIPHAMQLCRLVRERNQPIELFARVGKAVACIHQQLAIDPQYLTPLPGDFDGVGPKSCLHGDLSLYNVLYQPASDSLVMIDWSTSPEIGGVGNWGTAYWDVAKFARAAITDPPIYLAGRRARWELADAFLENYQAKGAPGALGRPFFDYCSYIHSFLCEKTRARIQWYRYARLALLNFHNFDRYIAQKISGHRGGSNDLAGPKDAAMTRSSVHEIDYG